MFRTIHSSLEFDTDVREFSTRALAEAYAVRILCLAGWPKAEAEAAVATMQPLLVADDGDDELIQIEEC